MRDQKMINRALVLKIDGGRLSEKIGQLNRSKFMYLTLLLFLSFTGLQAQQTFKYQATLPPINADGFYKVNLQPALVAKSQSNLADLRIAGQDGKFVPYIFGSQLLVKGQTEFIAFPKSKASTETDSSSIFIAENTGHYTIDRLILIIRHAEVLRTVNLSGSDDGQHWYAIKENMLLSESVTDTTGTYDAVLHFPSSNYHYFKIQSSHKNKEPIAILQLGIDRQHLTPPTYINVPVAGFTQTDSGKITRIKIRFNDAYLINQLKLDVAAPKFYKRTVSIYQESGRYRSLVNTTEITSGSNSVINLQAKTNNLELEIENDDNPALVIMSITAGQQNIPVISFLEKGKTYAILSGDEKATQPQYDLQFFTDSLNKPLPEIAHGNVTANPGYQIKTSLKAKDYTVLIWAAITAIVVTLSALTFKMMKEVKGRGEV